MLRCPRCAQTEFDNADTTVPFICPVPGCGALIDPADDRWVDLHESNPPTPSCPLSDLEEGLLQGSSAPAVISRRMQGPEELAYLHPRSAAFAPGDILVLREGQQACICSPGLHQWLTRPGAHPAARVYPRRAEGQPVKILFYDMRPRPGQQWHTAAPIRLPNGRGVRLSLRYTMTLSDPAALTEHFPAVPVTLRQIRGLLDDLISGLAAAHFTQKPPISEAQARTSADALATALPGLIRTQCPLGVTVCDIRVTEVALGDHLCPECGAFAAHGAAECANGHPLHWCKRCSGVLHQGVCDQGHRHVWCSYCNGYALTEDGKHCTLHYYG